MICDLFHLTSKSKICKNCNKEFRNRASEYCSTNCAMNDLHDSINKDKNYVHQIITAKLFSLNFECIAYSEQEVFEFINKLKDKVTLFYYLKMNIYVTQLLLNFLINLKMIYSLHVLHMTHSNTNVINQSHTMNYLKIKYY